MSFVILGFVPSPTLALSGRAAVQRNLFPTCGLWSELSLSFPLVVAPPVLVKIPCCDRSVPQVLGSLLPWAAPRHTSLCRKTSLTCVLRALLNPTKSSQ